MKFEFINYETKKKINFETEKHLIAIYGKNGSGKTTFSRINLFDSKYVFNEDFIYSNVFNVSEKGFTQTSITKENFSGLWLGENIVKIRQEISKIREQEKEIKENYQQIASKYVKFFSEQGIPFNYEQKTKEIKNDNFNLTDEDITVQASKYIASYTFKTDIKNKTELKEKINYLKKNDIYNNLILKIQNNKLLSELLLKEKNNYVTILNKRIDILKKNQEIIKKTENIFKEDEITDDIKIKVHEWYLIHEKKDHCIFCGNKNINESLEKWKTVFTNTNIIEKQDIIKDLDNIIDDCTKIVNEKIYKSVDEEIINYINTITEKIKIAKSMIEIGIYENINFDLNIKNIKIIEIRELTNNIINYSMNLSINSIEFYYNAQLYNENLRKTKTNELDKLMDTEGEIIARNINDIFKNLGLNKNINITVDKHSVPHKFAYSITNHKDVNELSDGQKHKLALAIFINSIINDDLTNKVIVIDDPVVSLDISSYILFKQFLVSELIKEKFKDSTKLILLTHDITYLYIQLSNIFNDNNMKNDTCVYKLSSDKISEIPIDYIKTDDISLFKLALSKCSNIQELKSLNVITNKIFRIIIDIRLRFYGISDTSEVGHQLLPIDNDKKELLQTYSNHLSKVSRQNNPILCDIYNSILYIKNTAELFGINDFISNKELNNIKNIISNNINGNISDDIFNVINSISSFLKKTTNKEMKGYVEHTRVSYTRNLIGLSLDDFFE